MTKIEFIDRKEHRIRFKDYETMIFISDETEANDDAWHYANITFYKKDIPKIIEILKELM